MSTLFSTCIVTDQYAHYSVCIKCSGTVNVLKVLTLINSYCCRCSYFRNYVSKKVLVFEILECVFIMSKNGIYACQNVIETC